MGTRSCLLPVRSEDSSDEGFNKWPFMTTHAWGEDPRGTWTLEVKDGGESRQNTGFLKDWQLLIHGTKTKPGHQNITHPEVPVHKKAVPDDTRKYGGAGGKSSVQITQITYSLANQPISSPYPVTPVVEPSPSEIVPSQQQQQPSPSIQSFLQQQQQASLAAVQPVQTVPSAATVASNTQVTEYTTAQQPYSNLYQQSQQQMRASASTLPTSNSKYEDFTSRTSIPSTVYNTNNNNYPTFNAAASQQMGITPTGYDQNTAASSYTQSYGTASVESPPTAAALAANGNLWDFFGRMNGRRAVDEDYYGPTTTVSDSGVPAQIEDWGDTNSFVQLLQRLEKINRVYD